MQQYEIVEAMGLTVVPVEGLRVKVALVRDYAVALVRPDLGDEDRGKVLDWLLHQALEMDRARSLRQ